MPKRKMPDLGFKRGEFEGRHVIQRDKEMYLQIREMVERLLSLPIIRLHTQREEALRAFLFNLRSKDVTKLPYWSNGIGAVHDDKLKALMAEASCLVCAYWDWIEEPSEPAYELFTDHLEYLDQVCRDPGTLRTTELQHGHGKSGCCRYRIINDRIANGNKMMEF